MYSFSQSERIGPAAPQTDLRILSQSPLDLSISVRSNARRGILVASFLTHVRAGTYVPLAVRAFTRVHVRRLIRCCAHTARVARSALTSHQETCVACAVHHEDLGMLFVFASHRHVVVQSCRREWGPRSGNCNGVQLQRRGPLALT